MKKVFACLVVEDDYVDQLKETGTVDIKDICIFEDINSLTISALLSDELDTYKETYKVEIEQDELRALTEYAKITINENQLTQDDFDSIKGTVGQMIDEYFELQEEK